MSGMIADRVQDLLNEGLMDHGTVDGVPNCDDPFTYALAQQRGMSCRRCNAREKLLAIMGILEISPRTDYDVL